MAENASLDSATRSRLPAAGHNVTGVVTYGPTKRTYALPELIQVVKAGDFESVLSFGVGVAQKPPFTCMPSPSWAG